MDKKKLDTKINDVGIVTFTYAYDEKKEEAK